MGVVSAALLLFLVMDPVGNVPTFLGLLKGFSPQRARWIILRELLIALGVLILFLFWGQYLLRGLQITEPALGIAGAIILFLISIQMIFANVEELFGKSPDGEPFIVPLAIPLIAGPTAMTTVLLLMAQQPQFWLQWLLALLLAWLVSGMILLAASPLSRFLGQRGLTALQRLMGMLLTTVAVQMFLDGLKKYFAAAP